jgi:hypothetical protein
METKIKTWHVIVWVVSAFLFFYSYPRLRVCTLYHTVISKSGAFETLSIKPEIIQMPDSNQSNSYSIGFAEAPFNSNSINSIRYLKNTGLTIGTDSNEVSFFFLLPRSPDDLTYDVYYKALNELPLNYFDLFFSNPRKMCARILSAKLLKIDDSINQNGIAFFETNYIKGVIRFGSKKHPENISAEIYSKNGNINQTIGIVGNSAEKQRYILINLLSAYKFNIQDANDPNVIDNLIVKHFSNNNKFVIADSNG